MWFCLLLFFFLTVHHRVHGAIVINEFLASNQNGLTDGDGDASDWIELYNSGGNAVDLGGLHLTDDASEPTQWTFPPGTILDPDSYLVVFASGKDDGINDSFLHTNFKLGASGEYLGLWDAAGSNVLFEYAPTYPQQQQDQSYGLATNGDRVFFETPTPQAANGEPSTGGQADPVVFGTERGFYDLAFDLILSTQHSGPNEIRYTLDGSEPSPSNGIIYLPTAPPTISTTTVVRAVTIAPGFDASPIGTHTYIFLDDVIQQPAQVANGFPNGKLQASGPDTPDVPIDFAMDQSIVQAHVGEMRQAMTSIPTMVLSASLSDIYGEDGFYFGEDVEKNISMEAFYADGSTHQQNAGAESHSHNRLKRAIRLNFRSRYGDREWATSLFQDFPVGGDTAENRVRRVILRSGNNRSWARAQASTQSTAYTLDEFYRVTQQAMSGYSAHGNFVHLYINGVYEGVYNAVERPDDTYGEIYFGGSDDDWYFIKQNINGSPKESPRWDYLVGTLIGKNMKDSSNYNELKEYLDVEAFADYMLLNFYTGMTDWPRKNWYALSRDDTSPLGPAPLKFVGWDGELTLNERQDRSREGATIQRRFLWNTGYDEIIVRIWHSVRKSTEFRSMMRSRAEIHTAEGAALSASAAVARWDNINDYVRSAIVAESARWGDSLHLLGGKFATTRTRDDDWQRQVDTIRAILEGNTAQFLDELDLLDSCDGFVSSFLCFFKSMFWKLVELFGFMTSFYR